MRSLPFMPCSKENENPSEKACLSGIPRLLKKKKKIAVWAFVTIEQDFIGDRNKRGGGVEPGSNLVWVTTTVRGSHTGGRNPIGAA